MELNVYEIGQLVRLDAEFTNIQKRPSDPDTVAVTVTSPAGSAQTFTYVDDPELVRKEAGKYYLDQTASSAGTWGVRWFSTGAGQAAAHGHFIVESHG